MLNPSSWIVAPFANALTGHKLAAIATAASTFEIDTIGPASLEGRQVDLVYATSAYRDKMGVWYPGGPSATLMWTQSFFG